MKKLRIVIVISLSVASILAAALGIASAVTGKGYLDAAKYAWAKVLDVADQARIRAGKLIGIKVTEPETFQEEKISYQIGSDLVLIPVWDESTSAVMVNENIPFFTAEEKEIETSIISYSMLDDLGRCGAAFSCLDRELLPDEERDDEEERSNVMPTGYRQNWYPAEVIERGFLYNRCHLIAWQLGGDANSCNLIAGTRYLNVEGMLPYENQVAQYLRWHPDNHILYRVTPIFVGDELNCRGVLMEAYSLEDRGNLSFCVFVYNEQPGILIDHRDGSNCLR